MRIVWEDGMPDAVDAEGCCPVCRHYRWNADRTKCLHGPCETNQEKGVMPLASAPAKAAKHYGKRGFINKDSSRIRRERQDQEYVRAKELK